MRPLIAPVVIVLASITRAWAWGPEGHSIIAEIAQRRLTPETTRAIEGLLGRGHSLAAVASWADDYRDTHPETASWHFVDIPLASDQYDPSSQCVNNNCVVG